MLKTIYLAAGGLLIFSYVGWAWSGMEWGRSSPEPVPKVVPVSKSSSHSRGRSRYGYYGGGGFSLGK